MTTPKKRGRKPGTLMKGKRPQIVLDIIKDRIKRGDPIGYKELASKMSMTVDGVRSIVGSLNKQGHGPYIVYFTDNDWYGGNGVIVNITDNPEYALQYMQRTAPMLLGQFNSHTDKIEAGISANPTIKAKMLTGYSQTLENVVQTGTDVLSIDLRMARKIKDRLIALID